MPKKAKYDLFINYSWKDGATADVVAQTLSESGLRVWFDGWSRLPGQGFMNAIDQALSESSTMVVLIGKEGLDKQQEDEIRRKLRQDRGDSQVQVVTVLLPGSPWDTLPPIVKDRIVVDLRDRPDKKEGLARLLSAVARPML